MKVRTLILFTILISACQESFDIPNGVPSVVKIDGNYAYTTNGALGVDIIDLSTRKTIRKIIPPFPSQSIDNIALADGFLFALDARGENFLSVFSLQLPGSTALVSNPVRVQGDPFTGIAARNGNVLVSGGTTFMNFRKYDGKGKLSSGEGRFGRDRGHPDVILNETGEIAIVSTDFNSPVNGERFGIISLRLDEVYNSPLFISELGIPGSGFTEGTTRPAGFPIQTAILNDKVVIATGAGLTIASLVGGVLGSSIQTDVGVMATDIAVFEDIAYVVGSNPSPVLVKVDLSDSSNPTIIESVPLEIGNSIPTSIDVNEQFIIIAANEAGLIFFDR